MASDEAIDRTPSRGDRQPSAQTMALGIGSPALNAASVAVALAADSNPLHYDQRGFGYPRTSAGMVDIGAYQHQPDSRIFIGTFEAEP